MCQRRQFGSDRHGTRICKKETLIIHTRDEGSHIAFFLRELVGSVSWCLPNDRHSFPYCRRLVIVGRMYGLRPERGTLNRLTMVQNCGERTEQV